MGLTTVLIISDNLLIRLGLRNLLGMEINISIAGEARNTLEAIACMSKFPASVILLAIHNPGSTSIDAITKITQNNQQAKILVITSLDDPMLLRRTMMAGARGHLVESRLTPAGLIKAILHVASGKTLIPLSARYTLRNNARTSSQKRRLTPLTPREKEVLDLIFKGLENSEIATTLSITEKTVKNHINSIYTKLHIQNRSQAIKLKLGKFDLQTGQYA